MWWPPLIFVTLVALVILQSWWQTRQNRRQRARVEQDYTAALLQQQREAFAQAQAQQQALFNSMIEGVLLLDAEQKVLLVNESMRRVFNLPADVSGKSVVEILRIADLLALTDRLKKEKNFSDVELQLPGDNAPCFQVTGTLVLDRDNLVQGYLLLLHDITRLKQLENVRQEFVANVSHELRTPLSLIKGFTETLLDGAKDNPEVATPFLQKIDKHADRLIFLIEDLLTISRLESGRVSLNCQELCLAEIVQRAFDDVEARAAEKTISLENKVLETIRVWADADRLHQVLFNLVENAVKYGRQNGRVTIEFKKTAQGDPEVLVADDGVGIPPDSLERIFERFYRVDRARSRDTGGTGLGLSIVKHIVQAHGGEVRVKSDLNKGSVFYFTLPKS
ncbi:MAG: sensor histidine kinase [Verrucomicrobiales bacterium]|nr:sensor histidine kinase [Verrucomicrobiales bacterium]